MMAATLGAALACMAFGLLSAWSLVAWRARTHGLLLSGAAFLSMAYFAAVLANNVFDTMSPLLLESMELLRSAAWVILLVKIVDARPRRSGPIALGKSFPHFGVFVLFGIWIVVTAFLSLPPHALSDGQALAVRAAVRVIVSIAAMALIEHVYRNTPSEGQWAVKFACFGIGAVFAYDFYLYSNETLFRTANVDIEAARGYVNALAAPLIAISFSRNPRWVSGIALSHRLVFGSTALIGSAFYLLVMATAGYYLRLVGGHWGPSMQLALFAGAVILLVAILSSGAARAWLRVFIAKHFYRYRYDYREEWLRFIGLLSQDRPALSERVIKSIAALVESPGGSLWLQTDDGGFRQDACWNAPLINAKEPTHSAFSNLMRNHQWIIDLDDASRTASDHGAPTLPSWLVEMDEAWIVVPLIMHQTLYGFVVLMRPRSKIKLDWEVFDLLRVAASQAASYLAQQQAADALLVARQFESFNRMSTFIVHDLKNIVSQLSLVVSNAERHYADPEFQRELHGTLTHSVQKMRFLLQRFHQGHAPEQPVPILLDTLLRQAVAERATHEPKPTIELLEENLVVMVNAALLSRIIGHLLQNASEATPRNGRVSVRLFRSSVCAVITIEDTGQGMSEQFIREKLFKPFNTTKSSGMGIGVFESRTYLQEVGGSLEVDSHQSRGTVFKITLPLYDDQGATIGSAA